MQCDEGPKSTLYVLANNARSQNQHCMQWQKIQQAKTAMVKTRCAKILCKNSDFYQYDPS
jgi:hypothetical protein